MPNISFWEILLLLLVILLVFGPKRLPEMGRSLGRGMREFKDSVSGKSKDEEERAALTPTAAEAAPPQAPATASAAPAPDTERVTS
jgi:sec-independent protein translocase protein TatA